MEWVLKRLRWKLLLLYLDDGIVYLTDLDNYVKRLKEVLRWFRSAGLKLKRSKRELFQKEVQHLGHVVSEKGVSIDPEKVAVVR